MVKCFFLEAPGENKKETDFLVPKHSLAILPTFPAITFSFWKTFRSG